ncbi:MAG TPA: nucleotide disphospho-sugar-binding domain-containing protein [Pyrinomonadaceae bacterium]|nr:nucleotide disphospho-sugar-binding domain-containing protein [Pyrinomonadaceae bacterium]
MSKNIHGRERIVLATLGSFGDVHPYVALALAMKERGLKPVIVTSEVSREKIESLGIEFHPMRPAIPAMDTPEGAEIIDKVVDLKHGAEYLFKEMLAPSVRESYEDLRAAALGADLLVTHPIVLAGPILAQKTGIPWVSSVLAPASLWSNYDPFVPPTMPWLERVLRFCGPSVASAFMKLFVAATNPWVKPVYEFRRELGLPKGKNPLFDGQYAPELNLALFSKVLYRPQLDWPANTAVTGFPFYDRKDNSAIQPEILSFLDSGPAPIVFTLGSSAVHIAGDFFRESIEAALSLKRRAILLVGADQNRPAGSLPAGIAAFNYAPYGELLPRAAAVVHHGGVGTTGQALRAGVPTLIMPFNHDQPDNAARVARLGVSRTIPRRKYKAGRVALELSELLGSPSYAERAAQVGREVRAEDGAAVAVDLIVEKLRWTSFKVASGRRLSAVA